MIFHYLSIEFGPHAIGQLLHQIEIRRKQITDRIHPHLLVHDARATRVTVRPLVPRLRIDAHFDQVGIGVEEID